MKKILLLLFLLPVISFGQLKISQLPENGTITGAEEFPLAKSGSNFKEKFDSLKVWINTGVGTVTSVGLTMPTGFSVGSSPVTGSGTIAVTGAGTTAQYIRGDGTLATYSTGVVDSLAQTIAVNGWLSGTRIPQTYSNSLATAITLIDSGWIIIYPGNYTVTASIYKDNVKYYAFPGATIRNFTNSAALFNLDASTTDLVLKGEVNWDGWGSFIDRHRGTSVNLDVEFGYAKSRGDTCINLRYGEDTLNLVSITGHAQQCDSFPANFFSFMQKNNFRYDVDSVSSTLKSAFRWDINGNGYYHGFISNIEIQGGVFKTSSATEYAVYVNYVGNDDNPVFGHSFTYDVEYTKGTKAIQILNPGFQYQFNTGHGVVVGDCDLNFRDGETVIRLNFAQGAITCTGFKVIFDGGVYPDGGGTMTIGATSTVWFTAYIRKVTVTVAAGSVVYFNCDATRTSVVCNGKAYFNGTLKDTSGITVNSGGAAIVRGLVQGNSNVNNLIVCNAGGTLETAGADVKMVDNSGSFNYAIIFQGAGTCTWIHKATTIVAPAAGACVRVEAATTVNAIDQGLYYTNVTRSVAGTYTQKVGIVTDELVDTDITIP